MSLEVLIVFAGAGVVVLLGLLSLVLAWLADGARAAAGPRANLAELEARAETRRAELAEVEERIAQARAALDGQAERRAEAEALQRRIDGLQAELAQLDDRRRELEALQADTARAQGDLVEAEADLAHRREDLEALEARAGRLERLEGQAEALEARRAELTAAVEALRGEAEDLDARRRRADELREAVIARERSLAALEGQVGEMEARRDRAVLEAADAEAERDAARAGGGSEGSGDGSAGGGDDDADPLEELRALPPALVELAGRDLRGPEEENAALARVGRHLQAVGLRYDDRVLRAFHTAMKVNDTAQMTVLAGISGTGKSQLPRRYAEGMGFGFLQVPVQPRWDSPQDLLGFYNYIERRFRPTDLARALHHARADLGDRVILVLLDEMNLARVEYYFSDFLSRLEARPPRGDASRALAKDAEIELEVPVARGAVAPRLFPGHNVLFAGTMNEDESTQSLSDKVVDRANVLRFAAPEPDRAAPVPSAPGEAVDLALDRARWDGWIRPPDHGAVAEPVSRMMGFMQRLERPFGYRLAGAVAHYVANYPHRGGAPDLRVPLADQVEMRLLPKLRGLDLDAAEPVLDEMAAWLRDDLGDAPLAEALQRSVDAARNGTGQFVWRGVARTGGR